VAQSVHRAAPQRPGDTIDAEQMPVFGNELGFCDELCRRFTVVSPRASCLSFSWLHIGGRCAPDTHLDQVQTRRPARSDSIGPRLIRAPESPRYPAPLI